VKMIAIAYLFYHTHEVNRDGIQLKVFATEEEGKSWFIREFVYNNPIGSRNIGLIDQWEGKEEGEICETPEEIRDILNEMSLKDIVETTYKNGFLDIKIHQN
jgi:hypothetical protein